MDSNEPLQMLGMLQQSVPTELKNLNLDGWADYRWEDHNHALVHAERKTWRDLCVGLDSIEDQLRREQQAHRDSRLILLVEGVAVPGMMGTVVYSKARGAKRDVFYASREENARYSQIIAWLYQVGKYLEVIQTPTMEATAKAIVSLHQNDQKEDHSTFHRYMRLMDWHPNPQIEGMIALGRGVGIGAAKAEALIKRFGTIYNVITAKPEQLQGVAGLGRTNSIRLLRKVGRTDV